MLIEFVLEDFGNHPLFIERVELIESLDKLNDVLALLELQKVIQIRALVVGIDEQIVLQYQAHLIELDALFGHHFVDNVADGLLGRLVLIVDQKLLPVNLVVDHRVIA
jgi:hypothetical protein